VRRHLVYNPFLRNLVRVDDNGAVVFVIVCLAMMLVSALGVLFSLAQVAWSVVGLP
jgi:hypothetical protein